MRSSGYVTVTVLAAALVAAGCSGSDEATKEAKRSQYSGAAKAVSMNNETAFPKPALDSKPLVAEYSGPASFAHGEEAYKAGDYVEAIRVFDQYTTEKPDNAWGHFMLGLSAWKGGDSAKAESAFEEALRIDPKHVKSFLNLSRVLLDEKRFDDAVDKLTQAGDLEPSSGEVKRLLGRAYAAQGNSEEAIEAYRAAISLDDKDAWAMNNLGLLFIEQNRFEEAALPLARAVELRNEIATFHNNLGMALEHTGRYTAAAAEYNGAIAADSGSDRAKENLARVEAVKVISEEPFDLAATAQRFVESTKPATEKSAAVQ